MATQTILITTTGTGSFVKPAGVTTMIVECWGAGATGGDGGVICGGSGGGGGGYARSTLLYSSSQQIINYKVGPGGGQLEASWWDDVGGPATQIGPYASPTTYYYKVRGAGGAQRNLPASCFEFGGTGGGKLTGQEYNPNVGDITYDGGDGAQSGGDGGGGGGGAGSTGAGDSPSGGVSSSGKTGGDPTSEFGGAGGTGGVGTGGAGTTEPTSGSIYGGGGGGGRPRTSLQPLTYGAAGAQGLIRLTFSTGELLNSKVDWNGNTLNFSYPLDNATAYSTIIDGSQMVRTENGTEYSWIPNSNYILEGDVRWISTEQWDGATGWRAFLEYARAKNPFTFYTANTDTTGVISYLVEPLNGEHSLEIDGTRRIRLVIRNTTTPYTGF